MYFKVTDEVRNKGQGHLILWGECDQGQPQKIGEQFVFYAGALTFSTVIGKRRI